MDDFNKDLSLAEKTRDQILNGLEQRANKNRMGETDALLDTRLKGRIRELALHFDSLSRQVALYNQNPEKYRMTAKELERRNSIVEVLENDLNSLEEKVKSSNKPVVVGVGVSFKRDGTEEAEGTKNLSNKDLMTAQDVMWKQQGVVEEVILGTTQNMISISRNMTDELDIHDKLLSDVNQNVDHTQLRMDKTNYRMKELLYKSSDCCLITVILILVAVVILIIFFL